MDVNALIFDFYANATYKYLTFRRNVTPLSVYIICLMKKDDEVIEFDWRLSLVPATQILHACRLEAQSDDALRFH